MRTSLLLLLLFCCTSNLKAQYRLGFTKGINQNFYSVTSVGNQYSKYQKRPISANSNTLSLEISLGKRWDVGARLNYKDYWWSIAIDHNLIPVSGVSIRSPYIYSSGYSVGFDVGTEVQIFNLNYKYIVNSEMYIGISKCLKDNYYSDTARYNLDAISYGFPTYLQYNIQQQNTEILPQLSIGLNQWLALYKRLYLVCNTNFVFGFKTIVTDYVKMEDEYKRDLGMYEIRVNGTGIIIEGGLGLKL